MRVPVKMQRWAAAAAALAASLLAVTLTAGPAPAASQANHHSAARHAAHLGAARRAGPYYLWAVSGSGCSGTSCAVGSDDMNAGSPVLSKTHPGRNMTFIFKGKDVSGYTYGLWQFSNGNYMAVTTPGCSNVTIKSDPTSNGTIWILYTGAGHFKFIPRFCSTSGDYGGPFMYTDNRNGDQWRGTGFDLTGQYEKVDLAIP